MTIDFDKLLTEPGTDHGAMQRQHMRAWRAARELGNPEEAERRFQLAQQHQEQWLAARSRIDKPIVQRVARQRRQGDDPATHPALGDNAEAVDTAFRALSDAMRGRGFVEAVMVGRADAPPRYLRYDGERLMTVVDHKGRAEPRDRCTWQPTLPSLVDGYWSALARGDVLIEAYDRAAGQFTEVHRANGWPIPRYACDEGEQARERQRG
jgi:hypothetical protein